MAAWCPGDVVLTSFGVGVIVSCPTKSENDETTHYDVRLWRDQGKSIGTTATAYLQSAAVSSRWKHYLYCY